MEVLVEGMNSLFEYRGSHFKTKQFSLSKFFNQHSLIEALKIKSIKVIDISDQKQDVNNQGPNSLDSMITDRENIVF